MTSSANPSIFGQLVTLSIAVTPALAAGRVAFYDGITPLGIATVANGSASLSTILPSAGIRSLKARFSGSGTYGSSLSPALSQTVSLVPATTLQAPVAYTTANANNQHIAVADFNGDGHLDIVTNNYTVSMGNGDGTFRAPAIYTYSSNSYAVVTGDFNGDGKPDFATAGIDGNIDVWLNKGDGTFQPPVLVPTGTAPRDLAVGDFNNDGIADIAMVSRQGEALGVGILLGVGDGTFRPIVTYLAGEGEVGLAVADFNGDGNADIVAVDGNGYLATLLLGAGDGTFRSAATYQINSLPEFVAVGDFNKDGKLDFVVAALSVGSLNVFIGNGDGTFSRASVLPVTPVQTGGINWGITVGDFDGDGNPDLAYVASGAAVSVFTGKGDGTFRGAVNFPAGSSVGSLIAAEFNGDGRTDLAVTNSSSVQILLGGTGSFPTVTTASVPSARGGVAYTTTLAATGGITPYTWSLSAGSIPLTVSSAGILGGTPPTAVAAGTDPFAVEVSGPTGPGYYSGQALTLQVALAFLINTQNSSIIGKVGNPYQASLAASGGTFPYSNWAVTSGVLAPGLSLDPNAGTIGGTPTAAGTFTCTVTVNDSTGLVSLPATLRTQIVAALTFVTQSLPNGFSGVPYYAVLQGAGGFPAYSNWTVASGALPPGLTLDPNAGSISGTPATTAGSPFTFAITFSDGNTVSAPQSFTIAVSNAGPATIVLTAVQNTLLGKALILTATVPSGTGKVAFYDGAAILGTSMIANGQAVFTTSLLGAGPHSLRARSFSPPASASISQRIDAIPDASLLPPANYVIPNQEGVASPMLIADFNGDGKADLASFIFLSSLTESLSIRLGNGDGTFQAPVLQSLQPGAVSMAAGDFNEDGATDLAVSSGAGLSVYLGKGDGTFGLGVSKSPPGLGGFVSASDFNGDGHTDLLFTNSTSQAQIYLGIGDGTFRSALSVAMGSSPAAVAVGDFNGDSIPDLVSADSSTGKVSVILGNGDGTFQAPVAYLVAAPTGPAPSLSLNIVDLNGDGNADLVVFGPVPGTVSVLLGRGDGTFGPVAAYALAGGGGTIAVSDFNGDGVPDLLVPGLSPYSFTLLLGNGDGSFGAGLSYPAANNYSGYSPAIADFNGDGLPDVALALGVGGIDVLLGSPVAGADQLTLAPASLSVNATQSVTPLVQTVTLTYRTTTPGTYTFSNSSTLGYPWVSESPASGAMTLASSLGSLYTYTAQVNMSFNATSLFPGQIDLGTITFSANGAPASLPVVFSNNPAAQLTGIVNAASGAQGTPSVVAPGSYMAIYGSGLGGSGNPSAMSLPLPTSLNGVQATLGGLPAPLLYAASGQINAIVPQELSAGNSYPLTIMSATGALLAVPVTLMVQELQPAIYTVDASGSGPGIVANSVTGQLISATNPAHASDYLVIYGTGLGPVLGPKGEAGPADGAPAPSSPVFHTRAVTTATIGGVIVPVLFSGLTPTLVGLYQVNIQIPAGVTPGTAVTVVINATDLQTGATAQSNSVTIALK